MTNMLLFPDRVSEDASLFELDSSSASSRRFLAIHLPAFRLERCGFCADEVVGLYAQSKNALRLVALTPSAREVGLRVGMAIAEARAIHPSVSLLQWQVEEEASDYDDLIQHLRVLSDQIMPWWENDLVVEITHTSHLSGGELGVLSRARALLEEVGHRCCLAIADRPWTAVVLANCEERERILPSGACAKALDSLPVALLRPSESLFQSLRGLGIRTIGEWARLEIASVAARFGEEGVRLHRIACGEAVRCQWEAALPICSLIEKAYMSSPGRSLEPVLFVLRGLLGRVGSVLEQRNELATELRLHFVLERDCSWSRRLRVGRTTRNPRVLEQLVRSRLERVRLEAPVVECIVEVEHTVVDRGEQVDLLDRREVRETLPDLVSKLLDSMGTESICCPAEVDSWRPEEAWRPRTVGERQDLSKERTSTLRPDPVALQEFLAPVTPQLRPTLLLSPPLRVMMREHLGRPIQVRWAERWVRICRCVGPERLVGEWWRSDGGFWRDYWCLDLPDRRSWVFCDALGRWYIHGWFD